MDKSKNLSMDFLENLETFPRNLYMNFFRNIEKKYFLGIFIEV